MKRAPASKSYIPSPHCLTSFNPKASASRSCCREKARDIQRRTKSSHTTTPNVTSPAVGSSESNTISVTLRPTSISLAVLTCPKTKCANSCPNINATSSMFSVKSIYNNPGKKTADASKARNNHAIRNKCWESFALAVSAYHALGDENLFG